MPVKVEVQLDVDTMSEFMIYHIYTGPSGMAILGLGALNVGVMLAFATRGQLGLAAIFLLFAILLLVGFPFSIKRKVKAMEQSKKLTEPATYEFSEEGIGTTMAEKTGRISWQKITKAVSRKNIIILYDAQRRAIILPVSQLGEKCGQIIEIIRANMPAGNVKIKLHCDQENHQDNQEEKSEKQDKKDK